MKKILVLTIIFLLIIGGVFAMNEIFKIEVKRDIPLTLNPSFIEKVASCGKLDLIDRASSNYNPRALVDGSLKDCDN